MNTWQQEMKKPSMKKAERLVRAAAESIGCTSGSKAAEVALQNLLTKHEMNKPAKERHRRTNAGIVVKGAKYIEACGHKGNRDGDGGCHRQRNC